MKVTVGLGRTYNAGNYQSVRIDVSVQGDENEDWYSVHLRTKEALIGIEKDMGVEWETGRRNGTDRRDRDSRRERG